LGCDGSVADFLFIETIELPETQIDHGEDQKGNGYMNKNPSGSKETTHYF
jgi:hypothetical protein